jgi:hypothetical protein
MDTRMQRFGSNLTKAFAAAGIALGTRELFRQLGNSIDAASALNEEIAKSQQIFGDSSAAIGLWAQSTARDIGVSRKEALAATGTFGNLFTAIQIGQADAANMSQKFVELAADMASFNNADISDVLLAIRSGLVGEAEPLRRYGVLLSEARVQQVAMANSGKENVKELTNQEKALARYEIIMSDTAVAQGDFVRTSDGLANQSRILRARLSDLQAEMGGKLLPTMVTLVGAANDLIDAFSQAGDALDPRLGATLEDVDISGLVAMRDRLAEIKGEGDDVVAILNEIISRLREVQGVVVGGPDSRGGLRGTGAIAASNAIVDEQNRAKELAKRRQAATRSQKDFDDFVRGMGLKLDTASLTADLDNDLAALRELEAAILRRIKTEGRTFKLASQLTQTRQQISTLVQRQAEDAAQAGRDAIAATMDALDLRLELAESTKRLGDDQAALRAIEQVILDRIGTEGRTTELLRQLFQVRQRQAEIARELADQRRERRKAAQFESLGLTEEGDKPTPGSGSLLRRAKSLQDQIKGTTLDTDKTRGQLQRIIDTLRKNFKTAGKEVRQAILDMLNDISSALEQDTGNDARQITPGGIRPLQRLIAGLNLTEEQIRQLEQNMQRRRSGRPVNAFGFDFDGGGAAGPARGFPGMGDFGPPNIFVTVEIDGQKVTGVVKKELQKTGKRRTNRRGGAGAGRGAIL